MSLNGNAPAPSGLIIPETPRRARRYWVLLAILLTPVCLFLAIGTRLRASWTRMNAPPPLLTLAVDRGDIDLVVTENGSLESSNNATGRCLVEALIGTVGGAQGAAGQGGRAGGGQGNRGGQGGNQAGGAQGGMGGQQGVNAQNQQQQQQAQPKAKAGAGKAKAGAAKSKTGAGASKAGAASGTAGSGSATGATGTAGATGSTAAGGASGAGGAGGAGGSNGGTTTFKKPTIRSFNYVVTPHVPLRPKAAPQPNQQQKAQTVDPAMMGGRGGGGGGGRGGGGRGGQGGEMEKPGSTRIISIRPEGTRVKAGDIVCELDSAAFGDELQAQRIRYIQAKAWVEQAQALLDVNEITLREYRDGIFPQDQQLIRQYLTACRVEEERAKRAYEWSERTARKGFRSSSQVKADALALQQARLSLHEAEGMADRLEKYSAPKLLKELQAKIEAIRTDQFAQRATFELESDRLKKLETTIENCTIRAPRDGIVVYANQSNRWGMVETQIDEGATVREGQAIFYVPDPNHMQVQAKVNESKVSLIQPGQPALIRIDAFPDRPLHGKVTSITPIPAPSKGASDVRVYYATVELITGGFNELRPGLTAEVTVHIETKRNVTRVPLQAIRWVGTHSFAAVASATGWDSDSGPSWRWTPVTLGLSDTSHAEVIAGLKPGERVIANPDALPPPSFRTERAPTPNVARSSIPATDKS